LQRAKLETHGQIARLESEIAEIDQMRLKYMAEKAQLNGERSRAALSELQSIGAELESIREKARKAENILDRADVEAPVAGTVVRLYYHTTGGVVESGRPIAEILPSDAPLIVEVKIPRIEIDSVSAGQAATVRLIALNQRTTPSLNGTVIYISADAIVDKTDAMTTEAYVARVSLSPEELQRVPDFAPTPGMPADIMIQTGERTFMQYLVRPIVDSMAHAFREK
jgi:HlyD family secretion protein